MRLNQTQSQIEQNDISQNNQIKNTVPSPLSKPRVIDSVVSGSSININVTPRRGRLVLNSAEYHESNPQTLESSKN